MEPLENRVPRSILTRELKQKYFFRNTNHGGNEIYIFTASQCPAVMTEIGRLREWAFREAGGGSGKSLDIDEPDLADGGYRQLVVWSPSLQEIVGGYRFIVSASSHPEHLSTEHYFEFSDQFRNDYLPYLIELGRAFVHPSFQSTRSERTFIYSLDNLWDGLGGLIVRNPAVRYLFGKVTMYPSYNVEARNILMYFLKKYFPDDESLLVPRNPLELNIDTEQMGRLFSAGNYADNYKILLKAVGALGESIPPMMSAYMSLSSTMKVFDTVVNDDFGNVEETGILMTIDDIYPAKLNRYTRGMK